MIEVARSGLCPRALERWNAAFARKPIIARPAAWIDPELCCFIGLMFVAAFIGSLGPWEIMESPHRALAFRVLGAAGATVCFRCALRMSRAHRSAWPRGRFLYTWGYAEIDEDVARVVPIEQLAVSVLPHWLGEGPAELSLRSERWSTSFRIGEIGLVRVAEWIDAGGSSQLDIEHDGYRSAPPKIDGPPPRARVPGAFRELSWVVIGLMIALAVPTMLITEVSHPRVAQPPPPPFAHSTPVRSDYARALEHVEAEPSLDLDGCSPVPIVIDTVATYLTLALERPLLGPARPYGLPMLSPRRRQDVVVWSRCAWEIDRRSGTLAHVQLHWGLSRARHTEVERSATLDIAALLPAVEQCRRFEPALRISPRGLAHGSAALARAIIDHDLLELRPTSPFQGCLDRHAQSVPVTHVLDPS